MAQVMSGKKERGLTSPPEPIRLKPGQITKSLFDGMRYIWVCGYDSASHGGDHYYECYHMDRNIYLLDAADKRVEEKLRKVFDGRKDASLDGNKKWQVFTPDACLCVYVHKDILGRLADRLSGYVPMRDEAWKIICELSLFKEAQPMEINSQVYEHWKDYTSEETGRPCVYIGNQSERYVLGEPGENNILIFGINPSTATPQKYDPTIKRVLSILEENKQYDGWLMVNLHPQVTPRPDALKQNKKWHENNLKVIREAVSSSHPNAVWCAWGANISKHGNSFLYSNLRDIFDLLRELKSWVHYGEITKDGHPRHPLYAPANQEFKQFPIEEYLSRH